MPRQLREHRVSVFFYGLFMSEALLRRVHVDDFALRVGRRATLVPCAGARAYGMLMTLTHTELDRLYAETGLGQYRPEAVLARPADSPAVPALCYNLPEPPAPGERDPEYMKSLRDILQDLGFPRDYIDSIS